MRLVAPTRDVLGEGPCWAAAERCLYWFDIQGRRLNWHLPETGDHGGADLPWRASAAAPRQTGGLIVATEAGLATFDRSTQVLEIFEPVVLPPGFRTNDGGIDPQGRFWWSIMDDDDGRLPGAILRTTPSGTQRILEGIHIPNGFAVTGDGATLYLADSRLQTIFAYELPGLSRHVFARTQAGLRPTALRWMPRVACGAPIGAAPGSCGTPRMA